MGMESIFKMAEHLCTEDDSYQIAQDEHVSIFRSQPLKYWINIYIYSVCMCEKCVMCHLMFRLIFETMFELFDYKPPNVIEYLSIHYILPG